MSQIPSRTDTTSTPVPNVGHDYIHAPVETVNPANGSLSIRIGVPIPPGRGGFTPPFNFAYDSNGAFYLMGYTNAIVWNTTKALLSQGGWSYSAPMLSVQARAYTGEDDIGNTIDCEQLVDFVMQDASGNRLNLGLSYAGTASQWCNMGQMSGPVTTAEIGPFQAQTTSDCCIVNAVTVTDGDGTTYSFPQQLFLPPTDQCNDPCVPTTYAATDVVDRNGNAYGITSGGLHGQPMLQYQDSVGRVALNIPTFGGNPDSVSVSGLSNPYQVYWTTVQPNFSTTFTHVNDGSYTCSTSGNGGQPSVPAISQILLPNGQSFTLSYDPSYGLVNKITYPTGGYVRYVWGLNSQSQLVRGTATPNGNTVGSCSYYADAAAIAHRYVSFDGVNEVLQQDFTYSTSWGISGNPYDFWNQKQTVVTTHDLARNPATVYTTIYTYAPTGTDFQPNAEGSTPQIPVESKIQYFKDTNTSGSPIRTVNKTWSNERVLTQEQTILDNNQFAETDWTYNSNEMETDKKDYDYGSGNRGNILRETVIPTYHSFTNHIVDKPDNVQVQDGSNNVYAGVGYGYDGNGNILSRSDWLNQNGSSALTTSHLYDSYGNITQTTDPANKTTTYSYTDSWVATCPGVSNTNAYLTKITYPSTNGIQHIESFAYNCPTGDLASATDMNGNTTSYQYNDPLARLKEIDYPTTDPAYPAGWGKSKITYIDTPGSLSMETQRLDSNGTVLADAVDLFDGLFHTTAHSAANGEATPWDRIDTSYDGNGRTMFTSYPCQISSATSGPSCPTGDTVVYDALGRTTSVTHSDGSVVTTNYTGRATDVLDEGNGNRRVERISQIDGLGRLQYVCEVAGQAQQNGGTPVPCNLDYSGSGFLTSYGYNQRGNLTSVSQGALSRGFGYDMQSRLTSATNPESGTITYNYDTDSNCPQPSYSGEMMSKVDARSIRTCLSYDAMHHLIGKSYSDGVTPAVTYNYDQAVAFGRTLTGTNGRKSSESTAGSNPTGEVFSYDALGHVIDNSQCTPQNCGSNTAFPVTYPTYNVLGSPNSEINGAGVTINYGYNSVGALYSVSSSLSDANHPGTLLNNVHYNAVGLPLTSTIGSFPLTDTRAYSTQRPGWEEWVSSINISGPTTQSTGNVTVNGSEGSQLNSGSTPGTGSATISGNEQSTTVQTSGGSPSSVVISVSGDEQSYCGRSLAGGDCTLWRYDSGTVTMTVNGCTTSTYYGQNDTQGTIGNRLAANFSCSTVTASSDGLGDVTFTSTAYSSSANSYSFTSSSQSNQPSHFSPPSFGPSPTSGNMSGGSDPAYTTIYDSGTATITANGHGDSYSWGNGASTSSIASGLASAINNDGGAAVSASPSGNVVYLTARTAGSGTNYSLSSSTTWNTSYFGSSSFAFSNSGSSLSGGADATYTYDNGTLTITANGTPSSASYGQGSTNSSVASLLASAVNANNGAVSASASGNVVTLTSRSGGAYTNYSLSASSSGTFNPPSFTTSTSGSSMTGGTGSTIYSLGVNYYNDGNVQTANDNVNGNWNYTYDDFNRLNTAVAANVLEGCQEQYDQYGNRWSQTPYGGSGYSCNASALSFAGNNNRIDPGHGYGYDAAGNVISDPNYSYTYDAENRIVAVNGGGVATYVYDAEGQRVRKVTSSGTLDFIYDLSGHVISEMAVGPVTTVDVRFTNDSCSGCGGGTPVGGGDRNLFVNSITIGTTTVQPSDPSISYTAAPCNSTQNNVGYILCTGDMISTNAVNGNVETVTIKAYGSPDYYIYPHMQVFINGTLMGEWDVTGTSQNYAVAAKMNRGEIYAGSMHLATYENGTTFFNHSDWLGSERVRSTVSGGIYTPSLWTSLPFGEGSSSPNPGPTHFTGKERDLETMPSGGGNGLDYFGARYYSSTMGRWMSPDWAAKPTEVPYADFGDPQSLNLYGYVRNNPMSKADPDGHEGPMPYEQAMELSRRLAPGLVRVISHPFTQAVLDLVGLSSGGAVETGLLKGTTSRAEQLTINKAVGKAFEKVVKTELESKQTGVVEQLTVKTENGVKTRLDFAGKESEKVALTEAKGSETAPLTDKQKQAIPEIEQTGCTVCGKGKPGFPGGTQIPPTKVKIVRPDDLKK